MYNYDKPQAPQHSLTKTKQASLSDPAHTAPDSLLVRFPPSRNMGIILNILFSTFFLNSKSTHTHIYTQVHAHTNAHMHTYLDMFAEKERKTYIYQPCLTRLLSGYGSRQPLRTPSRQKPTVFHIFY